MKPGAFDYGVLALGVLAVSTAAILISEAEAPALVIASYRLGLASLPLLVLAGVRRVPVLGGSRARIGLTLLSGLFLALHFAFWTASVQQTSIVTSVVLVTWSPLFIAAVSGPLLGERPTATTWLGIAVSSVGVLVMVADDLGAGRDTLVGDLYALLGALFAAGYLLAGRRLQAQSQSWLSYVTLAYSFAALLLIGMALIGGDAFTGYSTRTYALMAALALVPQLIGHTALNRSLGYLPAVAVAIAILGEPVGSTLLAAVLLDEMPTPLELAGGALVLTGVYVALSRPTTAVRTARELATD